MKQIMYKNIINNLFYINYNLYKIKTNYYD